MAQAPGLANPRPSRACGGRARHIRPAPFQNPRNVRAMAGAEPPDVPKDREETKHSDWFQMLLARFNPISGSATNNTVLDFEKPLFDLDNKILEVRRGGPLQRAGLALGFLPPTSQPACRTSWPGVGGEGVQVRVLTRRPARERCARFKATHGAGSAGLTARLAGDRPSCPQVKKVADQNGVDVTNQVAELEERARQARPGAGAGHQGFWPRGARACWGDAPARSNHTAGVGGGRPSQASARLPTPQPFCGRAPGAPPPPSSPKPSTATHPQSRTDQTPPDLQLRKETYAKMTPVQRLHVARHPNRSVPAA